MNNTNTVKAIQEILRDVTPNLAIDGDWGPVSARTYSLAPTDVKQQVDQTAAAGGLSIKELDAEVAFGSNGWVPKARVLPAVVTALRELDPTLTEQQATELIPPAILQLEARTFGNRVFLRSLLVTATSHAAGPFQFEPGEWNHVWREYPYARRFMNTYPNDEAYVHATEAGSPGSPGNLTASAFAMAGELLDIRRALAAHSLPITGATVYTLHNQGITGGTRYLLGLAPIAYQQSPQAIAVMQSARAQVT